MWTRRRPTRLNSAVTDARILTEPFPMQVGSTVAFCVRNPQSGAVYREPAVVLYFSPKRVRKPDTVFVAPTTPSPNGGYRGYIGVALNEQSNPVIWVEEFRV
jgi:hypothetical protein